MWKNSQKRKSQGDRKLYRLRDNALQKEFYMLKEKLIKHKTSNLNHNKENPKLRKLVNNTKLVYICSPLKGDQKNNTGKAIRYCKLAIAKGFIPIAPHIYFTQFLDDNDMEERELGLQCGLELVRYVAELWVFGNNISEGMQAEIKHANSMNKIIRYFKEDGGSNSE
jgi:hypothetical protein